MLRFLLKHTPVKRLARGVPVVALLSAAEVAMLAKAHLRQARRAPSGAACSRWSPKARGGAGALSAAERGELGALVAKLQPRAFVGSAADHFSPCRCPSACSTGRAAARRARLPPRRR